MKEKLRVMTEKPRNAETPAEHLRSWITANEHFFDRNQGEIPTEPIALANWELTISGEVEKPLSVAFADILKMPKAIVANTMECSGNSRSLLTEKAAGNPWTIGGVGNAVWGGVWLRNLLEQAGLKGSARYVAFEGYEQAKTKFVRSIPLDKALDSTLLAYEMNGEPLPLKHGYPLRALALGWTGANCVKWLSQIMVLEQPNKGFFMDNVYRVFQKGMEPSSGPAVTSLKLKSIITQPLPGDTLAKGHVVVLGAAYGGEKGVERIEVSVDGGKTWAPAEFIGPREPYAWHQWQYLWEVSESGTYQIMSRASDTNGEQQPMDADWNVLGYGNNGVREHAIRIDIA
ncbi:MAG: sulfite oxidase [Proteobacteria bacterium]|nr:sulfite oxidase [Pseudomonadota bacterium]MBU1639055.1 sulfite oxidase [Pseudomonadota bacterium]